MDELYKFLNRNGFRGVLVEQITPEEGGPYFQTRIFDDKWRPLTNFDPEIVEEFESFFIPPEIFYYISSEDFHKLPPSSQISILAHRIPVLSGKGRESKLPPDYEFPPLTKREHEEGW